MIPYVNQQCWVIAWLLSKLSEGFMEWDKYDKGPIHHDPFDTISTAWAMIVPTSTMGQSSSLLLSESCRQNMAGHEAGDYSGTWAWLQEPWNGGSPTESSNVGLLNPLKSIDTDCSSILDFPLRHYALNKFAALISLRHVLLLVVCVLCICLHGFPVPQGLRFIVCHPWIRNAWCPGKQRPSEAFPFLNTWEYLGTGIGFCSLPGPGSPPWRSCSPYHGTSPRPIGCKFPVAFELSKHMQALRRCIFSETTKALCSSISMRKYEILINLSEESTISKSKLCSHL